MLSVLCGTHFVRGLQARGECTAPSTEEAGCRWEGALVTWCPLTGWDVCWKYCLPTYSQQATCSPGALGALSLTSTPWHNSLTVGPSLLLLTILSDFSYLSIWAQSPSFHSRCPPGSLLPFLCQISSWALLCPLRLHLISHPRLLAEPIASIGLASGCYIFFLNNTSTISKNQIVGGDTVCSSPWHHHFVTL